jgi:hypothetical protein
MKIRHLTAVGIALFGATFSAASWAQDAAAPAATVGGTDHSKFVGSFGIGFMGIASINIADVAGTGVTPVTAPVIGGRYWLDSGMGIDAGLGIAFGSGSIESGGTSVDNPQPAALIIHGGVPLALADTQYFVFEIVPELNIGFAGNTLEAAGGDTILRGFHLDLGARAGAEVHFGFIDIPQLSLQAGIGLALSYDSTSSENEATDTTTSISELSVGTNVGNDPWDIFTSSITALYYFGG